MVTVRGPYARSLASRAWDTLTSSLPDMALRNAAPAYAAALSDLLATQRFAIVHAASIEMARYGLHARRYQQDAHLVLDEFNAEYVLQRRAALTDLRSRSSKFEHPELLMSAGYSLVQWRKLVSFERRVLRAYDRVLAVSEEDRQALLRLAPQTPISIVPNGVDTVYFQPDDSQRDGALKPHTIVFTGTLNFRPNVDAVRWFVRQVLPLVRAQQPAARCVIVGKSPSSAVWSLHDGDGVEVRADVPDVRPFIAGAAVYVVPMRMGGGVRLKLLEALAMRAPVVSTSMGAEGVAGLEPGVHALIADDPQAFAQAVLRLLGDPDLGQRIGTAGRALVTARYEWDVIVPALERVYTSLGAGVSKRGV